MPSPIVNLVNVAGPAVNVEFFSMPSSAWLTFVNNTSLATYGQFAVTGDGTLSLPIPYGTPPGDYFVEALDTGLNFLARTVVFQIDQTAPPAPPSPTTGDDIMFSIDDKLTIINDALINSANNPVETPDDGSDEWEVGSSAYEQWLKILLGRKTWKFDTRIIALDRIGVSTVPGFSDAYAKPSDSLYIAKIWRPDIASQMFGYQGLGMPDEDMRAPSLLYQIVGDVIHTTAPNGATAKYAVATDDPQHWSVLFIAALRMKIEAACYRSLNEDSSEGNRADKEAEMAFSEAVARNNSEEPRRVGFRSGLAETRRYGRRGAFR